MTKQPAHSVTLVEGEKSGPQVPAHTLLPSHYSEYTQDVGKGVQDPMAPGHRTQLDLQDASQKQQDKGKLGLEFGKLGLAWDSAMQPCELEKKLYLAQSSLVPY